jgi:hypothetical protein
MKPIIEKIQRRHKASYQTLVLEGIVITAGLGLVGMYWDVVWREKNITFSAEKLTQSKCLGRSPLRWFRFFGASLFKIWQVPSVKCFKLAIDF